MVAGLCDGRWPRRTHPASSTSPSRLSGRPTCTHSARCPHSSRTRAMPSSSSAMRPHLGEVPPPCGDRGLGTCRRVKRLAAPRAGDGRVRKRGRHDAAPSWGSGRLHCRAAGRGCRYGPGPVACPTPLAQRQRIAAQSDTPEGRAPGPHRQLPQGYGPDARRRGRHHPRRRRAGRACETARR